MMVEFNTKRYSLLNDAFKQTQRSRANSYVSDMNVEGFDLNYEDTVKQLDIYYGIGKPQLLYRLKFCKK